MSAPHPLRRGQAAAPQDEGKRRKSIDWRDVSLLGIDVGFSERRKTTGIASYRFGRAVRLHCVGSLAQHRADVLRDGTLYDAIAIDGPIVAGTSTVTPRDCERILARGAFGARCKAGFSHFGTGLKLRNAATLIASEMPAHTRTTAAPVVEAFPNAFLGVMLDDAAYDSFVRPIPRGRKSDIFFARAVADRCFHQLFEHLDWHDDALRRAIEQLASSSTRAAHEHRAALVCVLTAACALSRAAEYVGDEAGGFIYLPPRALWADWARNALTQASP